MLRLEPLLDRQPTQLSGGQRQRVAIGRAIVREPKHLPVRRAAVEPRRRTARADARRRSAQLHRRLGATMIYVTHDQVEAMTLADRIVVLRAGRVEQVGTPLELYNHPANRFVAGFIGSPRMNFLDGRVTSARRRLDHHRGRSRRHHPRPRHAPRRHGGQPRHPPRTRRGRTSDAAPTSPAGGPLNVLHGHAASIEQHGGTSFVRLAPPPSTSRSTARPRSASATPLPPPLPPSACTSSTPRATASPARPVSGPATASPASSRPRRCPHPPGRWATD